MVGVKVTKKKAAPPKARSKFATKKDVNDAMLGKLQDSFLDAKDAKRLGMVPMTADEVTKGLDLGSHMPRVAGFTIPYFDLKGKTTKFWRFRYLEPTKSGFEALTNKKEMRYVQTPKSVNELYLPPLVDWEAIAKDPTAEIMITEGELKAACATKMGIPTIGLGGVWCFKSVKQDMALLPMFKNFLWKDRVVSICYDSDAATNPLVISAENALARALTQLGAEPYVVRLPKLPGQAKTGLDDFLCAKGKDEFTELASQAEPWRAAQELHKLNEEVVYVRDPGVVIELATLQRIAPRAFMDHAYSTRVYWEVVANGKDSKHVERSAAKEWIKWPQRAEVPRVTYAPGEDRITTRGELNTWEGWGCEPVPGDITPWVKLLDYLFADAPELRTWFEQWCAYPLQFPGTKLYTCVVIHGRFHGTGKTLVGHTLFRIYGKNSTEIADKDLHDGNNDWAEQKQFVLGEEITGGDKRGVADRMKAMITQREMRINVKYIPKYTIPDCINYLFTSNHPDSFFLEDNDRRAVINEVKGKPLSTEFYEKYDAWLKGTGPAHLFHHLLSLDVSEFNPKGHAPMSRAKLEMIDSGRSDLGAWVKTLVEDADTVLRVGDVVLPYALWTTSDLLKLYDPEGRGKVTANGLGRELRKHGIERVNDGQGVYTKTGQQRLWAVRAPEKFQRMDGAALGKWYDDERAGDAKKKKY
jgi:hypothetical protein